MPGDHNVIKSTKTSRRWEKIWLSRRRIRKDNLGEGQSPAPVDLVSPHHWNDQVKADMRELDATSCR